MKDNCDRYIYPIRSNLIEGFILALDKNRLEILDKSAILMFKFQKATNEIDSDQCGLSSRGL